MAAPYKKREKILLEKNCQFQIGIRNGEVLELRTEGYLVFWAGWTDPLTGECHESTHGVISYKSVAAENSNGKLKVLRRPLAKATRSAQVRFCERTLIELARQRFKKQYVLAIEEMLDSGELKPTRDDFCAKLIKIVANGTERYREYQAAQAIREVKRGGAKLNTQKPQSIQNADFCKGFKSGQTMWKWFQDWRRSGDDGLFDSYRNCGKYQRYDAETEAFVCNVLYTLLDQERPTIKSCAESVQAAISAENSRRERRETPERSLPMVGYDYVLSCIKEQAPLDHSIRKAGWDKAYKDMHTIGVGVSTSRALERVEIDEYTVDLFVLMQATQLFDHLPLSIKNIIGLDGSPRRVTLSAAIDVHTRCLLALQIVPQGLTNPLKHTLEMIYTDKSPIADAAGAKFGWPMAGAPEEVVLDRGSHYITDDAYDTLACLEIINLGAPAGKPWLKPFIERLFRTIHTDLLLRFSGRAFSDVVERGENDPAARATLTLEVFLAWLVRWTVDAYHTRKHSALGMSPNQAWAKATNECAPRSLTSNEMREAFGTRLRRKLSRGGLRVFHIDYQADALMEKFLNSNAEYFEILRWHGDIGTISVRCDDGPWTTVPACDEVWIGKTDTDLRVWLKERAAENGAESAARRNFINAANEDSYSMKRLMGLISLPKTPAELSKDVERFMRHADTAERRHAAGPYRELLAGLDDGTDFETEQHSFAEPIEHNAHGPENDDSEEDSME